MLEPARRRDGDVTARELPEHTTGPTDLLPIVGELLSGDVQSLGDAEKHPGLVMLAVEAGRQRDGDGLPIALWTAAVLADHRDPAASVNAMIPYT